MISNLVSHFKEVRWIKKDSINLCLQDVQCLVTGHRKVNMMLLPINNTSTRLQPNLFHLHKVKIAQKVINLAKSKEPRTKLKLNFGHNSKNSKQTPKTSNLFVGFFFAFHVEKVYFDRKTIEMVEQVLELGF